MRYNRGHALALLACTQFLLIMDTAIINVAVPSIGDDLGVSAAALSWVANAYLVAFGGLLLVSGRIADLFPRRALFVAGLGVLAAGSGAGALAADAGWLIASRAAQGAGAAITASSAFALLLSLFPDGPGRHRALGTFAAMAGAGGAAGTVLGGVLTGRLGWWSAFGANVLAAVVLMGLAVRVLPETRPEGERRGFGLVGAAAVTAGLGLLAYGVMNTGVDGWAAPRTLIAWTLAALMFAAFVAAESRASAPLVPVAVLRRPVLRAANLLAGLAQTVLFPMFFLVSVYLQAVLGYSPEAGGLGLLPLSITVILVSGVTGRLITRFGSRPVMVTGFVLVAAGMVWLSRLSPDGSFASDVLWPSLVLGVALPLVTVTTNAAATAQAGPDEIGLVSGLLNTAQQFGSVIGLAALNAVAAADVSGDGAGDATALTEGMSLAFLLSAAVALASALYALTVRAAPVRRSPAIRA